jgi:low affinity Fe/Cu permease
VKAVIGGNNQQMTRAGDVYRVDGSRSYDEDKQGPTGANAGLVFTWSCSQVNTTNSCFKIFQLDLFQNSFHSPYLILKSKTNSTANMQVKISLSVMDPLSKRTDSTSMILSVFPVLYPTMTLSSNNILNKLNPSQALHLKANVSFPTIGMHGNLTWLSSDGLSLAGIASTPVFRTVVTSFPLRMSFQLALFPNSLAAGHLYSFGLKCQLANNIQVTSFISITVNAPPSLGQFVVSPISGTAYLEVFSLTCSGWSDSDLPLSYQFSFLSLTGRTLITKSLTPLPYSGTVLPEGQKDNNQLVTCQADIYDNLNANSTSFKSVEVHSLLIANISQLVRQSIDPRLAIDLDDLIKGVNIASSLLNVPNCSLSPNCTTLNRFSCLSTSHTCGPCDVSFISSILGDGNEQCVKSNSGAVVINHLPKRCYLDCSSRGKCIYFSQITEKQVETCFEGDLSCYSSCSCDDGYKMSNYCEISDKETKEFIALRELVVDRIIANTKLQDPTVQAVSGWMNSLLEISQIPNQISENALSSLLDLSSNVLSTTLSESYDCTMALSRFLEGMDSLAGVIPFLNETTALTARKGIENINDSYSRRVSDGLKSYSDLILQEMVPGQLPLRIMKNNFKLHIQSLELEGDSQIVTSTKLINSVGSSCVSNITVPLPQSSLERGLRIQPTKTTIPTCPDESNSLQFSMISLSSKLYESHPFTSNPVSVSLSNQESSKLDFSMQSNNEGMGTITMASVNRTVNCLETDFSNHTVSCSNHKNYTVACHGKQERIVFGCPALSLAPTCSGLTENNGCVVKSFGKHNISCSCPLTHSDSSMPTTTVTVVALLTDVEETFLATIFSASELNADTLAHSWEAIVTITVFLGGVVAFMLFSVYADGEANQKVSVEEKVLKHAKIHSIYHQKLVAQGRALQQQTQETETVNDEVNVFTLLGESLPKVLSTSSSTSLKDKIWNEEKKFHRYLGIVYYFSAMFPRILRVVSLASNIIIMLFIQSLTYNYTHDGDDASCSVLKSEKDCLVPRSTYGTGQSRCYWQPTVNYPNNSGTGECLFIQPENSLEIMFFVAIFSGLVSAPLAVFVSWIIHHILSAPDIPTISSFKNEVKGKALLVTPQTRELTILPGNNANDNGFSFSSMKRSLSVFRRSSTTLTVEKYQKYIDRDYRHLQRKLLEYRKTISNDNEHRQEIDRLWGFSGNSSWDDEAVKYQNDISRSTVLLQRLEGFISSSIVESQSISKSLQHELASLYEHLETEKITFELLKTEGLKSKRLLFLFQKDLTPGLTGELLESKEQRDNVVLQPVSIQQKYLAWFFLGTLDLGMLFYVFLFAISQDNHRQIAWGRSLGIYLLLDILLISTLMVIFMHVFLPAIIMRDVAKIQKKVTESIHEFYENLEKKKEERVSGKSETTHYDEEEEESGLHKKSSKTAITDREKPEEGTTTYPFNAVKYLFLSYRVASLYPDLKAAQIILSYSSPWPKQDYQHINNVKRDYSGKYVAITRTISIIVIFFLTNLLASPTAIQDMILEMATTAVIGYTFFVHVQLYYIYPALVIIPTLFICGLILIIRKYYWKEEEIQEVISKNEARMNTKTVKVVPKPPFPEIEYKLNSRTQTDPPFPVTNRRQSLRQGLQLVSQLQSDLQAAANDTILEEDAKGSQKVVWSSSSSSVPSTIDLIEETEADAGRKEEETKQPSEIDVTEKRSDANDDSHSDDSDDDSDEENEGLFSDFSNSMFSIEELEEERYKRDQEAENENVLFADVMNNRIGRKENEEEDDDDDDDIDGMFSLDSASLP